MRKDIIIEFGGVVKRKLLEKKDIKEREMGIKDGRIGWKGKLDN